MENPLKILMLEDSENDAGLAERALRKEGLQFVSKLVDEREEFIEALSEFNPDVILSDHSLPQFNSLEALKEFKKLNLKIPFILVTGAVSDEFAVNCLKMGADDYVLKSNLARLPASIKSALKQHEINRRRIDAEWNLRKQNEELLKTNKELDKFVYSVSHNLRSPLSSVLGLIHLAGKEDEIRGAPLKEYFEMMLKSINKLDDTLHEIIDYSKNARIEIENQKIDVNGIIEQTFEEIKYLEGYEKVDQKILVHEKSPLNSDPFRLSVIFDNLLANGIKFRDTNRNDSYLSITGEIDSETARFEVKDNGIGIPDELADRVFDMFYRCHSRSEGAGLGLYIVKETVIKLKGKIEVKSEVEKGTIFSFEIPNQITPLG